MTDDVNRMDALRASEQRLALALRAGWMVVYEWDLVTDQVTVNARFREIFGLPEDAPLCGSTWLAHTVHPDSHAAMDAAFAPDSDGQFEFAFRAFTPNGADLWVLTAGQATFAARGPCGAACRCSAPASISPPSSALHRQPCVPAKLRRCNSSAYERASMCCATPRRRAGRTQRRATHRQAGAVRRSGSMRTHAAQAVAHRTQWKRSALRCRTCKRWLLPAVQKASKEF